MDYCYRFASYSLVRVDEILAMAKRRYASDVGANRQFLGTYGYERSRLNKYHVTAYTVETQKTTGNKHVASAEAWGRDGLRSAKRNVKFHAHHRRIKTVVYNQTRKRYLGRNRLKG